MTPDDLKVKRLKEPTIPSPRCFAGRDRDIRIRHVNDVEHVILDPTLTRMDVQFAFERAGPREHIAWDPTTTTVAIVTCGGLCPGLNDVVRAIVMSCHYHYGIRRILGIPVGYNGFAEPHCQGIRELTPDAVEDIHRSGGTFLGSSRGSPTTESIVDKLVELGVDILMTIGGDGTQRGSHAIHEEITRRGLPIATIGVPKTIDNDISWVEKTFGFDTAVDNASKAIEAANVEAVSALGGIGLVKVMGRHSGFIAAAAAIANSDVNMVLVPEVPFALEGPNGLLAWSEQRIVKRGHAVIVVAEGAGQDLLDAEGGVDASGNKKLGDIGLYLKDRIGNHLKTRSVRHTIKYIDPSYQIRATPSNAADSILCMEMGYDAVHAAMAGRTDCLIGLWGGMTTHVPIPVATGARKVIDAHDDLWQTVLECTGQPNLAAPA